LAFGGEVCAVTGVHEHDYPPSPADAFQQTADGHKDTRRMWPFFEAHPHHGRTCFREGWHLHLEPPDAKLAFDPEHAAWRAPGAAVSPSPSSARP
jgi:hypothetical protein